MFYCIVDEHIKFYNLNLRFTEKEAKRSCFPVLNIIWNNGKLFNQMKNIAVLIFGIAHRYRDETIWEHLKCFFQINVRARRFYFEGGNVLNSYSLTSNPLAGDDFNTKA